jgi:hypothetical protein
VADVLLRNEQLPFAYFFEKRLCSDELAASLRRVLKKDFAVAGGMISDCYTSILCNPDDSVPFTVQEMDCTLSEWQVQSPLRHEHRKGEHPVLLPIFDSLFDNNASASTESSAVSDKYKTLLAIKVTYFLCGATCLGVTTSHCLVDTAGCCACL